MLTNVGKNVISVDDGDLRALLDAEPHDGERGQGDDRHRRRGDRVGQHEVGEGGRAARRHRGEDPAAAAERVAEHGLGEGVEARLHEDGVGLAQTLHDHVGRRQQIELDREHVDDRFPQEPTRRRARAPPARTRARASSRARPARARRLAASPGSSRRLRRTSVTSSKNRGSARILSARGRGRSIVTTRSMPPGRGLMTTMRVDRNTASAMLCVTKSTVAAVSRADVEQLLVEPLARHLVEGAERLVHQQDGRVQGERAGDRHALLHAARELPRVVLGEFLEADQAQQRARPLLALGARAARPARAAAARSRARCATRRARASGRRSRSRGRDGPAARSCRSRAPSPPRARRGRRRCAAATTCRTPRGR